MLPATEARGQSRVFAGGLAEAGAGGGWLLLWGRERLRRRGSATARRATDAAAGLLPAACAIADLSMRFGIARGCRKRFAERALADTDQSEREREPDQESNPGRS